MTTNTDKEPQSVTVTPTSGRLALTAHAPTVWLTANFARDWFNDAINEAKAGPGVSHRRREIIFSVAFAESYLLEWVRDVVLKHDFQRINKYFPPGYRRGVTEKWKEIPDRLRNDGLLRAVPDLSKQFWFEWTNLVNYRDGLIHARASRPLTDSLPAEEKPVPDGRTLADMQPGWAISVVVAMIRAFHSASGFTSPEWMNVDDE